MKTRRTLTAVFLSICMVLTNVVTVYAFPPQPSSFYGSVLINGANAPAGTIVSAWINGVKYSQAAVFLIQGQMSYALDVPGDDPQMPGIQGGVEGDTVVFKVNDLTAPQTGVWSSGSGLVLVNLTVTEPFPPVITEGDSTSVTMSEDGVPTAFALTLNATDANGDTITWSISTPAGHGTASASGTGASKVIGYTPNANYHGSDSFVVQASDGTASDTITVNVTIASVNDVPIAENGSWDTWENLATSIFLTASDIDGDDLTYILGEPAHGTLSGTAPNITYTPNANYYGTDSFTFKVNDGTTDSNTATVSITIKLWNLQPICQPVSLTTNEDTLGETDPSCTDDDGDPLIFSIVGNPTHGTASVVSGKLQYTPAANYNGSDSFTYRAFDGLASSSPVDVNVSVTPVNDAPITVDDTFTAAEDTARTFPTTGMGSPADNDIDVDSATLTVTAVSNPVGGTVTLVSNTITFMPTANLCGAAVGRFKYMVSDGMGGTEWGIVTLDITCANDAPVAVADSYTTAEGTALTVSAPGVLGNDTDVDGDTLTASKVTDPAHGTLTLNANGSFTYTPNAYFNGTDSFTYRVYDAHVYGNTVTVTINVTSVNNAPVCSPVSLTTAEDTNGQANPSCTDPDGDSLTYSIVAQPSNGTAAVVAGKLSHTPALNFNGSDSFTYKASDGTLESAPALVTVNVTAVNDLPTISNITDKSTNEDTATGDISFTVGDVETAAASLTVTATSSNTALVPNANITLGGTGASRTLNIAPVSNQSGTTTITVTVNDGNVSSSDTFVLTVNAANDLPTISNITDKSTNEDTLTGAIPFTVGDVETAAASLTVTATSSNATLVPNGNITLGGSGASRTVNISPTLNQFGTTTITVTVSDGVDSTSDTFLLTVNAVNDAPTISNITDKSTNEDTPTGDIAFTVGDVETAAGSITVTATSSNTMLVPNGNITFGGTGANRTLNITTALNQNGTATITVTVNDGETGTANDTFVLTVNAVNDAPTISDIADKSTPEDTSTGNIAFTVGDVETPASLTVTSTSSNTTLVPNGNITLGGSGANRTISILPAADKNGAATITVTVSDGNASTSDSFVLTVTAVNDAPVAVGEAYATNEDTTLTVPAPGVLSNDSDVDANPLTAIKVTDPTHGTLTLNANGSFTYVPEALYHGVDSFTYKANDGTADSNIVTVTINVSSINNPPVAVDDTFTATEDTVKTLPISGAGSPAANDTDLDSDTLTVTAVSNPVGGTVSLGASITFTPTANLCGTGAGKFNYTVSDGNGGTDTGLVTLDIACVNDLPTISDITNKSTNEDTATGSIAFTIGDVESLASLTVTATSSNTTLVPNANITLGGSGANRTLSILPAADQTGSATITVTVDDGTATASDTFLLTVNAVNDLPTISNIADTSTNEDTSTGNIAFTVGDVETPAASLTVTAVSSNTTLVPNANITLGGSGANRTISILPGANQSGTTTITVTVTDANSGSAAEPFELTVVAVNDLPTISDITDKSTNEDTPTSSIPFTVGDVETLAADLTVTATSSNTALIPNGNIVLSGTGASRTVVITPAANQSGTSTITITVDDGIGTISDTFLLTVNAVNDLPTISNITDQSTNEDTATGNIAFTMGDVETPAADLTITATSSNTALVPNANITLGGSGTNRTISLAPVANQNGTTTITVTVTDANSGSASDTFVLTVNAVNDAPTISNITDQSTNEDTATGSIAFTIGDIDTSLASLTLTGTSSNTALVPNGNIVFSGTGANRTVVITPAANKNGTTTITITVGDGSASTSDTFLLTVNAVNDLPVAADDAKSTLQNTPVTVDVLANDSDADGDTLTISAFDAASLHGGTVACTTTCLYTPTTSYVGIDTFTYTISDGHGGTDTATVTIDVGNVNEVPTAVANSYSTNEDTALTVAAPGVLGNDTDPDGDSLTAVLVTGPANGTLALNANGSFTYTPSTNYAGSDSFTYKASDGTLTSNTVTVTITVTAVNDLPTVSDITNKSTNEDTSTGSIAFTVGDVESLAADLTVTAASSNTTLIPNANITLGGSGANRTISIMPAADRNGTATITVTVTDPNSGSASDTFVLTVNAVNDAPVITGQTALSTPEETALTITLSNLTVTDVDNTYPTGFSMTVQAGANYTFVGNTITPAANFNGTLTVPVKVNDGNADSNIFNLSVTVTAVNDAPTISDITNKSTNEDTSTGDIAFTVGDVETPAALTVTASSSNTTLVPNANITLGGSGVNRTISLLPASNQTGTSTVTVTVSDGTASASDTFVLTVNAVNDLPTITDITDKSTNEDTATGSIAFTVGDVETAAASLTVTATSSNTALVPNANIALGGSGVNRTINLTPAANQNGATTITVTVTDANSGSVSDTFVLTVNAVNDAPVAVGETYSTAEDTTLTIAAPGVLTNDTDIEGTALSAVKVTDTSHGALTLNANGSLTYVPATNYNGADSFTYKANDGSLDSNVVTVTINVTSVNNAPVAVDDTFSATEDTVMTFLLTGAGSPAVNDTDADGDTLTVTSVSNPTGGTVSLDVGLPIIFMPTANLCGTAAGSFQYVVSDGNGGTDTGLVTLNITCANDTPVANAQSVTTDEDTAKSITLTGSDVDAGTTLTFTVLTQPAHGTLSGTAPTLTYTPAANYTGSDSFTFRVSDGTANSNTATVSITVTAINDAPVANAQSVTTNEDTSKAITLTGSDVDTGATLTYSILSQPANGTLSGTAPNVTYTPNANFNGSDSFTFRVSDGTLNSNTATVSITVTAVNDAPVANAQSVTTAQDTAKTITLGGSDVEGSTLTYTIVTQPAHGALTGTAPIVTYTPAAHYFGADSFTFKVNDGSLDSAAATVSITVTPAEYTLTVTTVGSGSVTRNPAKATYRYGDVVQLTAVPVAGWQFSAWSGDLSGSTSPQSITITGNQSVTATFIEAATQKPGIPTLLVPGNCSAILDTTPWFDWSETNPAASYYRIQVANNSFFISPEIDQTNITISEYTPAAGLEPGMVYFWRVQAYNSAGEGSGWSSLRYFRLIPQAPSLIAPANEEHIQVLRPDLDWSGVDGAGYYTIQISKDSAFTKLVMLDVSLSSDLTVRRDLPAGSTLYWHVRAESFAGASAWSETWSFTTANPPGVPSLISPRYGAVTPDTLPLFRWSKVSVPGGTSFDHYQFQVSTDPSFDLPIIDLDLAGVNNTIYTPLVPLSTHTKYYWRVRAVNTDGDMSSWSSTWMFHTPRPKPPRWRTGTFSSSGEYVNWEGPYSVDETLVVPAASSAEGFPNWNDVANATGYVIQISTESTFSSAPLLVSATTVNSEYRFTRTLTPGTTLYWRVLTINAGFVSNWSETFSFPVP